MYNARVIRKQRDLNTTIDQFINQRTVVYWISTTLPLWVLAFLLESVNVANLAALWGAGITLCWVWANIASSFKMIQLVKIGAVMLCLLQNTAWISTELIHVLVLHKPIQDSIYEIYSAGLQLSSFFLSIVYVILFCMGMGYFGSNKRIALLEVKFYEKLLKLKDVDKNRIGYLLVIFVVTELALISAGVIRQRAFGVGGNSGTNRAPWVVFYESLTPVQVFFNALLYTMLYKDGFKRNVFLTCTLISSFLVISFVYFTQGRSTFMFCLIAHAYWFIFYTGHRPKFVNIVITVCVLYPIVSMALLFNNFIRSESGGLISGDTNGNILEVIPAAWQAFQSSANVKQDESDRTTENLSTRTLVVSPLSMSIQLPVGVKSFSLGVALRNGLVWALPPTPFLEKKDFPNMEELLFQYFPIVGNKDEDLPDSVYLYAYVDFGWFGLIIYPFLLSMFWVATLRMVVSDNFMFFFAPIIVANLLLAFMLNIGESPPSTWFGIFRFVLLWVGVNYVYIFFFTQKVHSRSKVVLKKIGVNY